MKRIFIAVEISGDVREFAAEHISELKKIRCESRVSWEKAEKMHLTLRFLGEIDEAMVSKVSDAVAEAAKRVDSFRLAIARTGVFPNKRRPKVLWLGIHDSADILPRLREDLDDRLEKIGFEKEKRRFRPHLTIARIRNAKGTRNLVEQHLEKMFEPIEFGVSEIAVMESRLENTGSVHTKRFSAEFL